jgi:hypothetical protein
MTLAVEPVREGHHVERVDLRIARRARGRDREAAAGAETADVGREAAIAGQGRRALGGRQRVDRRQQAFVPVAIDEEALLGAVAEAALVVRRPADAAPAQPEFLEQLDHLGRPFARQRQVVRTERAGDAADRMRAAVAAGGRFEVEHAHVVDARSHQRARRAEAGNACTDDQRAGATLQRRLGQPAAPRSRSRWPSSTSAPTQPPVQRAVGGALQPAQGMQADASSRARRRASTACAARPRGLRSSRHRAVQMSRTSRISLIRTPPGTTVRVAFTAEPAPTPARTSAPAPGSKPVDLGRHTRHVGRKFEQRGQPARSMKRRFGGSSVGIRKGAGRPG